MKPFAKRQSALSLRHSKVASAISIALGSFITFNAVAEQNPGPGAEKQKYEKIVVTGQKISRTLQETPASIAVFTSDKMEQQNLGDISEVMFETANIHSNANGGFSIRGIDGFNVSGAGSSGLASIYIDGSAMPRRMVSNGFSTWDVSQIEVFKGPQSTLQGRNSLAGAVIMTTQAPTHDFGGQFRVQLGQNGEREFAIAVGGSLIEDELAVRFSAESEEFDGFNYNPIRNEHSDFREDKLYRLKFLYTPQSLPELTAQLSFTHALTDKGTDGVNVPASGSPFDQRIITNNDKQELNYKTNIANLEVNYDINENWRLTSVSTYSKAEPGWLDFDDDNGPEAGGTRFFQEQVKTVSQELRFTFNYDNVDGIIGAYYFDEDRPSQFGGVTRISLASAGINAPFLQAGFGLDEATANYVISQYAKLDPVQLNQNSSAEQNVATRALFADATYHINEQWDIFAGIRWDREQQDNNDAQSFSIGNIADMPVAENYPAPLNQLIAGINARLIAQVDGANNPIPLVDASFNEVIPKLGVSYHWNDDMTTSFVVQKGYRSGGVGVNGAKAKAYQFDPEFTTNYELSMRSFWLDGDLMVNANAFYIDWKDQQVNVQLSESTFDAETRNAGSSVVKGFELEAYYQVNENVELSASIGQADSEFKDFLVVIPTAGEDVIRDLSGRSFADSPEWTSSLAATYSGDTGFFANLSLNYANSSKAEIDPDIRGLSKDHPNYDANNDGRTLVNMKIGYEWDDLGIYLIGKNLLDKEYISGAAYGAGRRVERMTLGEERQMSISLRGKF